MPVKSRPVQTPESASADQLCRIPTSPEEPRVAPRLSDLTWRIFRIMAEFVEGFQFLSEFTKEITIFGSARTPEGTRWYNEARTFGRLLAEHGFTVITGGGPGIMEAANRGAYEAGGESIGLNIQLPTEQRTNPYVKKSHAFHYFFTRKVMLDASAQAYVFFPGGFGTLDELFEILTLIQTGKAQKMKIVLVGKEHWQPLVDWMHSDLYAHDHEIDNDDFTLFELVDTAQEAFALVKDTQERSLF